MALLNFYRSRLTSWPRCLTSFVAAASIGLAGVSMPALAQPAGLLVSSFKCAQDEGSDTVGRAGSLPSATELFQAGIDEAADGLAAGARSRRLSPRQKQARAEFVFSNMLFVATHELGHALVSELDLMVRRRLLCSSR